MVFENAIFAWIKFCGILKKKTYRTSIFTSIFS